MVISAVMKDLEASKDPKLACNAIAFIFDVVLNPVAVGTIRLFEPQVYTWRGMFLSFA